MTHVQSSAYIETPQILLPVEHIPQKHQVIHSEPTENFMYPSLKIKQPIRTKLLAPNNSITELSYTKFG